MSAIDVFRIGTDVHALMPGGLCAFALVTRWDRARQLADLAVFPGDPDGKSVNPLVRLPHGFPHREQPGPSDELTFHVAATCPWHR
jgi:hypothetical protein